MELSRIYKENNIRLSEYFGEPIGKHKANTFGGWRVTRTVLFTLGGTGLHHITNTHRS